MSPFGVIFYETMLFQILTIEKERRDVKSQRSALDEQKRLLANDKEKLEQKIDQVHHIVISSIII